MKGLSRERTQVLSSDLTAASDLLPLDLVSALCKGFIEGSGMRETETGIMFADLLLVLTGP